MKKFIIVLIVIALVIGGGILWWNLSNHNKNNEQIGLNTSNYQAQRSGAKKQNEEKNINTNIANLTSKDGNNMTNTNTTNVVMVPKTETEIAKFSTKIHNKDAERQSNIAITCKTLSTKEVNPGETFSFCDTVGKSTAERGYQEADIYVNGEKKQGLGGGNCQVSTTLYNAVLQVPELEVVERHQHSGHVPYIEEGKDAAVSYGAYDFKFKNNTQNVIKIVMESAADSVTARLIKID